jgi:hypothetical protein
MNWTEARQWCDDCLCELEDLRWPVADWPLGEAVTEVWGEMDRQLDPAIVAAILYRETNHSWPVDMSRKMAELVCLRLEAASLGCRTLAFLARNQPLPVPFPATGENAPSGLVAWLVDDYWDAVGFAAIDESLARVQPSPPTDIDGAN